MPEKFSPQVLQEALKSVQFSLKDKSEVKKETYDQQKLKDALSSLDASDIGNVLKDIMSLWLEHNVHGNDLAREVYFDKFREKKNWKVSELLEVMGDVFLGQHPDLADKFHKKEISWPQLSDAIFDDLFQWARRVNSVQGREKQLAKIEQVINRFRQLFKESH